MSLRTKERKSKPQPKGADLPSVKWMVVTPELAEMWLEKNHERQRHIRPGKLAQYARDMELGRWQLSDQCVTFDRNKRLINGQTRLSAVIRSGLAQTMLVGFGFPPDAFLTIDVGLKRNTDDVFKLAGRDYPPTAGGTVRAIINGQGGRRAVTDQEIDEFMQAHGESVRFAHSTLIRGKAKLAAIRAVVARAHAKRRPVSRLREFARVLDDGLMARTGDAAGVLLRNYLMEADRKGETKRRELYRHAETALWHFCRGEQIKDGVLVPAPEELFPLPGEDFWSVEDLVHPGTPVPAK